MNNGAGVAFCNGREWEVGKKIMQEELTSERSGGLDYLRIRLFLK